MVFNSTFLPIMTRLKNRIPSSSARRSRLAVALLVGLVLLVGGLLFFHRYPPQRIIRKISQVTPQVIADLRHRLIFSLAPSQPAQNLPASPSGILPLAPVAVATGPLHVSSANPRYFEDGDGMIVYLTGSHTWSNLQDNGPGNPPPAFNYTEYLDFLTENNHNFFRLWVWEQARWTVETSDDNYRFNPMPFARSGPGTALDGLPKYNLAQFNQAYFDRMRARIIEAGNRGIYVSIMLFNGWSIEQNKGGFGAQNPWRGHPFNPSNNINSIDGDTNNNDSGEEIHTLAIPTVTSVQEAYVRKVIDTVNDLDNVLYEISNESPTNSLDWQQHMVSYIDNYQAGKPKQHPVGITIPWPNGWNPDLFTTNADWISPNAWDVDYLNSPPAADGSKVIIADTDHICGVCGDRVWVWKSFTRGENVIFMDVYDGAGYGVGAEGFDPNDPIFVSARKNMGYTLNYARRMNMAAARPLPDICSTGYCLANPSGSLAEFLVYSPSGGSVTVNLSAASGEFDFEWLNPSTGLVLVGGVTTGGGNRSFQPPFNGDAVLYIHPSIGANKIYLPVIWARRSTPTLPPAGAFIDTFDGQPSIPTTWQSPNWDVQIHSRDTSTWQDPEPMQAAHGSHCEPHPAMHALNVYSQSVFQCRDHIMTAINASGYGVIYLTPNRMIDFSSGEAVLQFDMSTLRTSHRDWVDIWITPFNDNLALPFDDSSDVDLAGAPKNAIFVRMNFGDNGVFSAQVYRNFQSTNLATASMTGYETVLTPSARDRATFELRISQNHLRFGLPAHQLWWIDTNIDRLDWTRGIVQFGHHSYNPLKDCEYSSLECIPNTWHWDNVSITPAIPFSMVQANQRIVRNGDASQAVAFAAPAPSNAFLRFAGIGRIEVSFDGRQYIPAVKAQSSGLSSNYHPEHLSSYWMPVPQGAQRVWLRFSDDSWYTTSFEMIARDFSIWSLQSN
jgi:hypothetical protein